MTRAGVQKAAQEAVALARAAQTVQRHRVELAPAASVTGTWMTPVKRDPLEVPLEEKIALLIKANEAALRVKERPLRLVRVPAAARGKNARHLGRHQRHADVHPRRPVFQRHRHRTGRFPDLRARNGATGTGLGIRRVARHSGQCRALGVDRGRKAHGEERRGRSIRSHPRSDQPLADHSRIDRPPDRAGPGDWPGGQLRGHELRRSARQNDRQAALRPGVHERAGRPHPGKLPLACGLGR